MIEVTLFMVLRIIHHGNVRKHFSYETLHVTLNLERNFFKFTFLNFIVDSIISWNIFVPNNKIIVKKFNE